MKDNAIGRRYDRRTGSTWLMTVSQLFHEGYIVEDDIKALSDQAKAIISGKFML